MSNGKNKDVMAINKGDKVKWKWGQGYTEGEVEKTYSESTTRKIKGSEITRNGSKDNKALYIKRKMEMAC